MCVKIRGDKLLMKMEAAIILSETKPLKLRPLANPLALPEVGPGLTHP